MKPETLKTLKQFLAAEWGMGVDEVRDEQVVSHYSKRWAIPTFIVLATFAIYFWLRFTGRLWLAAGLVVFVSIIVGSLIVLVLRSKSALTPGRLRRTHEVMSEVAVLSSGSACEPGAVSPDEARGFAMRVWRGLVFQIIVAIIIINVVCRLLGANVVSDVATLALLCVLGVLSGWQLSPHRQPESHGRSGREVG